MVKWKLITAGLLVLSIILCMMTIYTQREYYFMQMMYNRVDAENIVLKKDYEKLYAAYYSYDKKILKILEKNEDVFWSKDSTAYLIKTGKQYLFAFNKKKPKMDVEYFLWPLTMEESDLNGTTMYQMFPYANYCYRVDTLKPHQFILFEPVSPEIAGFIIQPQNEDGEPDDQHLPKIQF